VRSFKNTGRISRK
jgi:light-regulated signal transduction histidine kinase (bacteriophytochrome)